MKKVISVIIVLICVLMIGSSFADTKHWVFDGAYDFWKDLNKDFIDICNEHEDQDFVYDGCYYAIDYYLSFDYETDSLKDLEKFIEDIFQEHGIKHVDAHISKVGVVDGYDLLYVEINTVTNLNEIDGTNIDKVMDNDGSQVYCSKWLVAWVNPKY